MASKKGNKNLLPLLAVTVLMLSVGIVNYFSVTNETTMVLGASTSSSDQTFWSLLVDFIFR